MASCTACSTNLYAVNLIGDSCNLCSTYYDQTSNVGMVGCLECSSNTECTLCDLLNNFSPDGNGGCICADLFALNNTSC